MMSFITLDEGDALAVVVAVDVGRVADGGRVFHEICHKALEESLDVLDIPWARMRIPRVGTF